MKGYIVDPSGTAPVFTGPARYLNTRGADGSQHAQHHEQVLPESNELLRDIRPRQEEIPQERAGEDSKVWE